MAELKQKLSEIQVKMKAPKELYNKFGDYKYRSAEGILEAFKPYEKEYKVCLTVSDSIVPVEDRVYVRAEARLADCESDSEIIVEAYAREPLAKKGMDESQITGATSSYARKYALNGLLLLDDTKDPDTDEYRKASDASARKTKADSGASAAAKEPGKGLPALKKEIIALGTALGGTKGEEVMGILKQYTPTGNPNAIKDAGKGEECLSQLKELEAKRMRR